VETIHVPLRNHPTSRRTTVPRLDPEILQIWLEWAGSKILALPSPKLKPQGLRVFWPDYPQDPYEVLYFRPKEAPPIHAASPTAEELPFMDRILVLPNLCTDVRFRRVIHARSLVFPFSGRHLYPWLHIAYMLHVSRVTVRSWHKKGLLEISSKISDKDHQEISEFFDR
jgi:hypothetical protein